MNIYYDIMALRMYKVLFPISYRTFDDYIKYMDYDTSNKNWYVKLLEYEE
jgi:hypothetical protein